LHFAFLIQSVYETDCIVFPSLLSEDSEIKHIADALGSGTHKTVRTLVIPLHIKQFGLSWFHYT